MTQGARLKQARERLGISQEAVAKAAGLTRGRISQIESGTSELMAEPALRIADELRVNVRWLVLGVGPMEGDDSRANLNGLSDMAMIVAKRWDSLETVAQGHILQLIEYLQLVANPRYWGWSEKQRKAAMTRSMAKILHTEKTTGDGKKAR